MTARHSQAANPLSSPLDWMPLDFVMGRIRALFIRPEKPPFHIRSQVWGRRRGVGANPEVFGLLSLCSVMQLRWLFTWFSFFGFLLGCEVVLFSELILFHVT